MNPEEVYSDDQSSIMCCNRKIDDILFTKTQSTEIWFITVCCQSTLSPHMNEMIDCIYSSPISYDGNLVVVTDLISKVS